MRQEPRCRLLDGTGTDATDQGGADVLVVTKVLECPPSVVGRTSCADGATDNGHVCGQVKVVVVDRPFATSRVRQTNADSCRGAPVANDVPHDSSLTNREGPNLDY